MPRVPRDVVSLYERLDRIAALLEADLDDEGARLGVHVAVRAGRRLRDSTFTAA